MGRPAPATRPETHLLIEGVGGAIGLVTFQFSMAPTARQSELQQRTADTTAMPGGMDIKVMDESVWAPDRHQPGNTVRSFGNPQLLPGN